jgi:hypothetical protein
VGVCRGSDGSEWDALAVHDTASQAELREQS